MRYRVLVVVCLLAWVSPTSAFAMPARDSVPVSTRAISGDVNSLDPSAQGPYDTRRVDVVRSWSGVDVGFGEGTSEDVSEVTYPVDASGRVAAGRFPVVLILHGMHDTCSGKGPAVEPVPWWCLDPGEPRPVPNYQGYRYLADVLASQGRVVVSVSANGANFLDFIGSFVGFADLGMRGRALLVGHHLRALREANLHRVPILGSRLVGHLDLRDVVLVGHSRGGEGVVRAAQMLERMGDPPAQVGGVITLAPTAFAQSAPANTPTATLLPACDGDVSDLQGQLYVDRGRDLYGGRGFLRSSVWFAGGNHNYLNTEWTPGLSVSGTGSDDADRAYPDERASGSCRPAHRLSPSQERAVGLAYVAGFVRWTQDGDARMESLFDGTGALPADILRRDLDVRSTSLAGPDRLLEVPGPGTEVGARRMDVGRCRGSQLMWSSTPESRRCAYGVVEPGLDTAWLGPSGMVAPLPARTAVHLSWRTSGAGWMVLQKPRDLSRSSRLALRVVVAPQTQATFQMVLRDSNGHEAAVRLRGLPLRPLSHGPSAARLLPQVAWIRPTDARGIDLTSISAVGLAVTGSGRAWLLDISHRTHRPAPAAHILPLSTVVSSEHRVPAGTTTINMRVALDRPAPNGARLAVMLQSSEGLRPALRRPYVRVPAGATHVDIPLLVTMPAVVGPDDQFSGSIDIYPLRGLTVAGGRGYLSVVPEGVEIRTLAIVEPSVTADPGESLAWDFTSSDSGPVVVHLEVADASMDYADIDAEYRESHGLPSSGPIVQGSELDLMTEEVAPGLFRAVLPLDRTATPGAWISYRISGVSGALAPPDAPALTGTVGQAVSMGSARS